MLKCGMYTEQPNVLVDRIEKEAYVWYEADWVHDTEAHSHQRGQLVYVEKGFQYLHILDRVYLLPQNHAAWIPPHLPHRTTAASPHIHLRTVFYHLTESDSFYQELRIFSVPPVLKEMILYASKWSTRTEYIIEEATFLKAILLELPHFFKHALALNIPVSQQEQLIAVCNYIMEHFDSDSTMLDIAEKHNLSLRSLERLFKNETGITVSKYLQLVRIIKGVEFLSSGNYNVSEVAYKVGYKSIQAFSASFYALLHKRPNEFLG